MAESLTIARPYAEAAFQLAKQAGALPSWSDALGRLTTIAQSPTLLSVLGNPRVTPVQVAGLVSDAAGSLTAEQKNFVSVLAQNDRVSVLPEIEGLFTNLRNQSEAVLQAEVTSAYPMSDAQLADVVKTLEAKHGKKVQAKVSVNADLIGGVSIRIGDEVTDVSVRAKLAQLATSLLK